MSGIRAATARAWLIVAVCTQVLRSGAALAAPVLLDNFEDPSGWSATASDGTEVWILPDSGQSGNGLRIGFDLNSGGGYVIVRKTFALPPLPPNYAFTFSLRGEAPPNNFEFKLIDPSGNVWWRKQRDFRFPTEWERITVRKARIEFAWGPSGGHELKRVAAIEFAISAGSGGKGSIWIDDLAFEEREPSGHDGVSATVTAASSLAGQEPGRLMDGDPQTSWKSEPLPESQWVQMDLLKNCEFGGLVIDWDPQDYATAYQVQVSNDAQHWTSVYETTSAKGGRDYIYMPDAESRFIRLQLDRSSRGQGYGIVDLSVKPFAFSASPNQFIAAIAQDAPVGTYPKYFYGKQTYWTVVGVNWDDKEALLNEEGMLEVDRGAFSVEPFVYLDGTLITWNAVHMEQSLEAGYLPIPSVTWEHERFTLKITAFASGEPKATALYAKYQVENRSDAATHLQLFLAIRPFQVNPPWQSLNMNGGVTAIRELRFDGRAVWVNRDKVVISISTPDAFGATTFEAGAVTNFLRDGKVPPENRVSDAFGFASGALQYTFDLKPRGHEEVDIAVPFHEPYVFAAAGLGAEDGASFVGKQLEDTRRYWQRILGRVDIQLPPAAEKITQTLKTTVAYILINRDGPAIKPGPRNYARSWIRDGALTSTALLEMGCPREARDFIQWYARYQLPNGKVPCCVDRRGADPVPENDSQGEFIYAIMEYYRYTRDVGFLEDMWPHVVRAVDYLSSLRRQRMTAAYRTPEKEAYYGLLPESISHEGYTAHPVHSYWDDFLALRGLKDAATIAATLGDEEHAASFAALRDDFARDLYASIARTMANHQIDYLPASAELGDFDPTSTAIALAPGGEAGNLPAAALARTFERYYEDFDRRRRGEVEWDAYTPYELRNVGALIRMGQRERALDVLSSVLADQRPPAWNEWAEVVWRDPAAPRFVGDMPHTWVGSGFITAVRSLFAFERESDRALVIAAGVPAEWVVGQSGVTVKRLPTYYGALNYNLQSDGPEALRLRLSGDVTLPPGNIIVQSPLRRPLTGVTVNGRETQNFSADSATITEFPADVVLWYRE
jgi:hypothetical protein